MTTTSAPSTSAPSELDGPSICDVLPGAATLLGVDGAPDPLGLADELGRCRQVVVVLVDGLGLRLLPRLAGQTPFLAEVLGGGRGSVRELRSTFPSTTPTSLVSLSTGARPGAHGVLGFTVALPDRARTLTHIAWRDQPDPAQWQPVPTWFERLADVGQPSALVLPAEFEGSGLTTAAYRGATFVPSDGVDGTDGPRAVTTALAAGARLVYTYTDVLDAAMHRHGIASDEWLDAAAKADRFLATIAATLPDDACLLVTADHGGLDVPRGARIDMDADEFGELRSGVELVAGEPRVRYLHVRPGAEQDVRTTWRSLLGERALVLTRDEAIDGGWFGPVPGQHRDRIGDVVVICRNDSAVLASDHEPKEVSDLVGFHGSFTDAETAVPLIAVRA